MAGGKEEEEAVTTFQAPTLSSNSITLSPKNSRL